MKTVFIKLMLTKFSTGNWGFATKKALPKISNSFFSGVVSSFDKTKGQAINQSTSPIAGVEGYLFLDEEFQSADSVEVLNEVFGDGCMMEMQIVDGQFIPVEGAEPMTVEDFEKTGNTLAEAPTAQAIAS